MIKVLRLDTNQKYLSIAKSVPNTFTVNYADTTTAKYAAVLDATLDPAIIPESSSWAISADDSVIFFSDKQLMEFASA